MKLTKVAIDACLSPRLAKALNDMYRHLGYEFIHVNDFGGGDDLIWSEVFSKFGGKIVLSGDTNIAKRPHQQAAFIECKLTCFFPSHPFQNLTPNLQCAYLIYVWELIHKNINSYPIGTCWKIPTQYRTNSLTLSEKPFVQMKIPKSVLNEFKKPKTA